MIVVAYGANLDSKYGNPIQTFDVAKKTLEAKGVSILNVSSLYDTSPVGINDPNQPRYTNAVMIVETEFPPHALLQILLDVEQDIGRTRSGKRNEARAIDLDLIAYHDQIIESDYLTIPHPRMHERKFVLHPLQEISPDWCHPLLKKDIKSLMQTVKDSQDIRKIET
jgi:2-amino-4-hydroxy-6-hydroxymethyldihydropteridine diphosphokinase